jgi:hypothetical protein
VINKLEIINKEMVVAIWRCNLGIILNKPVVMYYVVAIDGG